MSDDPLPDELLLPRRDALHANQRWNGEEPLLEVAKAVIQGKRELTEREITVTELATGDNARKEKGRGGTLRRPLLQET